MTRRQIGESRKFECKIDGVLHTKYLNAGDQYMTPIDVSEHRVQRGPGHEVECIIEPIFQDGGPKFVKGNRVVHDTRFDLIGTVIGTLVDVTGIEWVGYVNDLRNPHLEDASTLLLLTLDSAIRKELFDPTRHVHFAIDLYLDEENSSNKWRATVKEYPMLWWNSPSQRDALRNLMDDVDEALDWQQTYPNDPGRFRP